MELRLVELEPRGTPPPTDAAAFPVGVENAAGEPAVGAADRYLAEATREYQGGQVDQPLWTRAAAQPDHDEAAILAAYLRARATALQLAARHRATPRPSQRLSAAKHPDAGEGRSDTPTPAAPAVGLRGRAPGAAFPRQGWIGVGAAVAVTAAAAWLFLAPRADHAMAPPVAGTASGSSAAPSAATHVDRGAAAPVRAAALPAAAEQLAQREAKVQELMNAGNWNVLVLHAAEWTRKDPANANAWKHLSVGYANLRQTEDAFSAADKASQLAPTDREVWKNLGRLSMAASRPEVALQAFEQAVALDEQDAASLEGVGRTNLQLGRLPQARAAFDRALAVSPDHGEALCGQWLVAQKQGRGKEADAIAKDLKRLAKECGDVETAHAGPAITGSVTIPQPTPGRGR